MNSEVGIRKWEREGLDTTELVAGYARQLWTKASPRVTVGTVADPNLFRRRFIWALPPVAGVRSN
jgi:hypothetical protein